MWLFAVAAFCFAIGANSAVALRAIKDVVIGVGIAIAGISGFFVFAAFRARTACTYKFRGDNPAVSIAIFGDGTGLIPFTGFFIIFAFLSTYIKIFAMAIRCTDIFGAGFV